MLLDDGQIMEAEHDWKVPLENGNEGLMVENIDMIGAWRWGDWEYARWYWC